MNFRMMHGIGLSIAAALAFSACTDLDTDGVAQAVITDPSVTTDQTTYTAGSPVVLTYANLPGNQYDWVAISSSTSADTEYLRYQYVNGQPNGMVTFSGLGSGAYEARAYVNDSYTVIARSSFTVSGTTSPTVSTDHTSYTAGQTVTINYANLPGNTYDWVAVSPASSPATSYFKYAYTNGATSGSASFTGVGAGNWEARAYVNDTYTVIATSTFTVQGSPAVTTNATTYTVGDVVTVSFTGLPGNQFDWVDVAQAGSPDSSYVQYDYTGGQINGSRQYTGLPAGMYVARAFLNDTYTKLASSATFTITSGTSTPSVSTSQLTYTAGQVVTANWSGLPGNTHDWVSIAVASSPATSFVKYVYTNGQVSGSNGFTNIPAGSYEVRAYSNDTYNIIAMGTFTVTP
jgi:hypothetical protein